MKNEDLLGLPYQWNGRAPEGVDCWQLCREIRNRAGLQTPDFGWVYDSYSEEQFDRRRIAVWLKQYGKPAQPTQNGAVTFINDDRGRGLVTSDGERAWLLGSAGRVVCVDLYLLEGCRWVI